MDDSVIMADSINERARERLTRVMSRLRVEIGDTVLPLLNSSVKEITLKIKKGEVEEIRPLYNLKK